MTATASVLTTDDHEGDTKRRYPFVLRAVGFCGVDDSVSPNILGLISTAFPVVEWGVLFRPDRQGQPRYATLDVFVRDGLAKIKNSTNARRTLNEFNLAAHLCGEYVHQILTIDPQLGKSDTSFLRKLHHDYGFNRVQINATAVNGVDTSILQSSNVVAVFLDVVAEFPDIEFILQKNDETKPLWQGVLDKLTNKDVTLTFDNISMLVDESKGTGVLAKTWPAPQLVSDEKDAQTVYKIGYAGGIGPDNVRQVIDSILDTFTSAELDKRSQPIPIWIDMESSLRSTKNDKDVFDVDKCFTVLQTLVDQGLIAKPECFP